MSPDHPSDAEASARAGDALLARGEIERAIASYQQALALNPQLSEAHLRLASARAHQGKLVEATESCRKAVSLDPTHCGALNELATLLGRQGKLDEACVVLQRVLALDPNHGDAHCNLGNVLLHQGKLDEACISFQRVLALNPNHILAHNNLGALLERQGRIDEAHASLQKALALNPRYGSAHNNLGRVLLKMGKSDEAIASCRTALAINPNDVKAHENLGTALRSKGELAEAAGHFRRAIALGTTNPMIRHALAALDGKDAGAMPAEVVAGLFDDYASRFDAHLVGALGYSAPKMMREAVARLLRSKPRFQRALDLGCGTGLIGEAFRDIVSEIDGVDLSPKMLEQARGKQLYATLDCEDIVVWLERSATESRSYDIVFAADVFVYVGNVEPCVRAIRAILARDGLLVFSMESLTQGSFKLLPSGHYAHSTAYVRELASRHGFTVELSEEVALRRDKSATIAGMIFVLKRR